MTYERSFVNWNEGMCICCWDAPSEVKLAELFRKAGTPFEKIVPVEEYERDAVPAPPDP